MKKLLTILAFTLLITGIISLKAFAASTNNAPDEKRSHSEIFYSKDNYNLTIETQNTSSSLITSWGASIDKLGTGSIEVQGLTKSYMSVDTIGHTLYVEKYQSGSWSTIKTFSYSLNNTYEARNTVTLSVPPNNYYRVRSVHYIIYNGVQTSQTSTTSSVYIN